VNPTNFEKQAIRDPSAPSPSAPAPSTAGGHGMARQAYAWMYSLHKKVVEFLVAGAVYQDMSKERPIQSSQQKDNLQVLSQVMPSCIPTFDPWLLLPSMTPWAGRLPQSSGGVRSNARHETGCAREVAGGGDYKVELETC